ncbi:MAG: SLBB domain-containing protein [Actinobacteria bacterium]|nr:SLBB domain-containing protein [Actinomycetota bacterium]
MTTRTTAAPAEAPHGVARLLAGMRDDGRPVGLQEHLGLHGPLVGGSGLIERVTASGLRGRGGGGFPTGTKLRAVADQRKRPFTVVNGTEGEPASRKDKALLRTVPHLVLDGALTAATAVGSREIIICIARSAARERAVLAAALAERRDKVHWRLASIPDGFVSGEETALLSALGGRAAKPTVKPPYPFERGLDNAPSLVQNAETLAHVALIARHGPGWFRSLGTETEPGTALVSLSGAVRRPGVYEIELGTPLQGLIAQAGGPSEQIDAYLVGGYFGGWTREADLRLTASSGLGAGVVVALPTATCALAETARIARYLANESAGQCGPCARGLAALAGGLEQLASGKYDDRSRLARWAQQVAGRGACHHPDGAARFVTSALATFAAETDTHLKHRRCRHRDRGVLRAAGA